MVEVKEAPLVITDSIPALEAQLAHWRDQLERSLAERRKIDRRTQACLKQINIIKRMLYELACS